MHRLIIKVNSLIYYFTYYIWYKLIFKNFGSKSRLYKLLRLEFPENISIGANVHIGKYSWLAASPNVIPNPELKIGNNCVIGSMNQIYSNSKIIIEANVLTADRVYISDGTHEFDDISIPIMKQKVISLKEMTIGEGSWIGTNVCIYGASIGKNCVVGANSVVRNDIPDYCVAVGAPAKIVKRFSLEKKAWCKTDSIGNFI